MKFVFYFKSTKTIIFSLCIENILNDIFIYTVFRFGYKTLNETRKVWQRTIDAGIPLVSVN